MNKQLLEDFIMAKKDKTKTLEAGLWEACNQLRGSVNPFEYMQVVFGLLFLRFATEKFNIQKEKLIKEGDEDFLETPSFYLQDNVFFIPEESRWDYISKHAKQTDIAIKIDNALQKLEEANDSLAGCLPKGYYTKLSITPSNMASLVSNMSNIDIDHEKMDDFIGIVYEYFMNKFADLTKKDKGEFYTPRSIVELITELIEPYPIRKSDGTVSCKVYDPCCGTGGMFIQSRKFVEKHQGNLTEVSIYGQEKTDTTYRLARMNLAIRGISANIGQKEGSTFTADQHKELRADYIMANPPFNLKGWREENELLEDPRWNGYEIPPISNANYAWILHMLSRLSVNGVAGFLLANGALSASGEEYKIRKQLIDNDKIEAIIVLPREMFFYTDISVTLWIITHNKKQRNVTRDGNSVTLRDRSKEILFMDLRTCNEDKSPEKTVVFTEETIKFVKGIFQSWQDSIHRELYKDIPELCKSVKASDLIDYSLVPSKYIEFIDHDLDINYEEKMKEIQMNMKQLMREEKETHDMLIKAFDGIGYSIYE